MYIMSKASIEHLLVLMPRLALLEPVTTHQAVR